MRLAAALIAAALLATACGSSEERGAPTAGSGGGGDAAATRAAADRALAREDYDGAIQRLRSLGGDAAARRRLAEVRKIAGEKTLANARVKLRTGQTRAAVSQATTAIRTYGNDTASTRAFLKRAERAQAYFHACQQRRGVTGEQSGPCERAAAARFGR